METLCELEQRRLMNVSIASLMFKSYENAWSSFNQICSLHTENQNLYRGKSILYLFIIFTLIDRWRKNR